MSWICHAQPDGKQCGHFNEPGIIGLGMLGTKLVCCEKCGRTKKASDDRLAAKQAKQAKAVAREVRS